MGNVANRRVRVLCAAAWLVACAEPERATVAASPPPADDERGDDIAAVGDAGGPSLPDVRKPPAVSADDALSGRHTSCSSSPFMFSGCGGDVEGAWVFEGFCLEGEWGVMYEAAGDSASEGCEWERTGALPEGAPAGLWIAPIEEWPMHATLDVSADRFVRGEATALVPLVTHVSAGCAVTGMCSELGYYLGNSEACVGEEACVCEMHMPPQLPALDVSYRVMDSRLVLDEQDPVDYCVEGPYLRIRRDAPEQARVEVYRRQDAP